MRPFVDYLNEHIHNAETTEKADRAYVTIGLIDNGVNSAAKQHNIPKIAKGKSYYGERAKSLPFRDFFTGPSLHGTWMAACINEVCPMADLYVVRLDDSLPNDKFTVDSAIKVRQHQSSFVSRDLELITRRTISNFQLYRLLRGQLKWA